MVNEITIGNDKYKVDMENNSIKRYNQKYKMWVNVVFMGNESSSENQIIKLLSNEFLFNLENKKSLMVGS